MDHAYAAATAAPGLAQELAKGFTRFVAPQAVQIELGLDRPDAAAQLAHHLGPDAAAPERQRVVGFEQ